MCKDAWIKSGKNRFAFKESEDFTNLITQIARNVFLDKTIEVDNNNLVADNEQWLQGEILSAIFKERWFAFITAKECDGNVYFYQRSYSGPVRNLIPGQKVRFLVAAKKENGEMRYHATKVELL